MQLEVDGTQLQVEAAVSEKLPVEAILGEDVPQLRMLLESIKEERNGAGSMHAYRGQHRRTGKDNGGT